MGVIEVPKEVYEILKTIAEKRGRSIEEIILEPIVGELDPKVRVEIYVKLHEKHINEAEGLHNKGDLVQASEKYWGAVTTLLSAIAEMKSLPHYTHRDFWEIVEMLVEEGKNPEYSTLFRLAEGLHANFYHNFMKKESFEKHREGVLKLIEILKDFLSEAKSSRLTGRKVCS